MAANYGRWCGVDTFITDPCARMGRIKCKYLLMVNKCVCMADASFANLHGAQSRVTFEKRTLRAFVFRDFIRVL